MRVGFLWLILVRPPSGYRAANSGQRAPVPDLVQHETPSGILLHSTVRVPAGRLVKPSRPAVRVQHPQSRLIEARVAERRQHGSHQPPVPCQNSHSCSELVFLCALRCSPVLVDQAVDDLSVLDPGSHIDHMAGLV
jgi:hypothetical protein